MRTPRSCLLPTLALTLFASTLPGRAQSVPCAAITRNPHVLDALLNSRSTAADSDSAPIITISRLQQLHFNPIAIQPGDALYVEYRGEPFDLTAHLANGDVIGFDSAVKARPDQWRKGVYPLDMFGRSLDQKLIRLTATAKNPAHVLLRNIRIVRAGKPVFEFSQLSSYGQAQVKTTATRKLPCKGNDEYPNIGTAFTAANRSAPSTSPTTPPLTLTAQEINRMVLDDTPAIQPGDFMLFETNRRDFTFHILLSNGKEIVSQPLTKEDADDTSVAWRQGRIPLDYPDALNQRIVKHTVVPLHEGGTPLLIRGIKIDGKHKLIYELEKSEPGMPKPKPVEPPMSYPPDPHVMTASASKSNTWGRQPETGFLAPKLPSYSIHPMMFQSTTSTGDPNHFKWNGKELDAETGLYNFGARYYSPALGRFVTPDPKIISKQRMRDPQQWNMYSYSRNNPTSMFDPNGEEVRALDAGALNHIRQTLPGNVRSSVVTDKNGVISAKALSNVKSSDPNFLTLKHMVDAKGVVQVSTGPTATNKDGKTFEFKYESSETVKADMTAHGLHPTEGKDYSTIFSGYTYPANQSQSGNIEVHVSDGTGQAAGLPDEEQTVTMGHELYVHGDRLLDGRPYEHEDTRNGEVNKETHEVEERTRKNAKEKDPQ